MINVGVTGANGQLGQELQWLAKTNEDIQWFFFDKTQLDISDPSSVAQLNTYDLDVLINTAAYTQVDQAEEEKHKAFIVNGDAVKNLAYYCKKNTIILIHISTDYVYNLSDSPISENHLTKPINVYGESKLQGENYIREIKPKYFIIRTSWLYSSFGKNFVKTMLRLAKDRNKISVVDDQIGSPTYARDLAEVILLMILQDNKSSKPSATYNFANIGEVSWFQFAQKILKFDYPNCEVLPIPSVDFPTKAQRSAYSALQSSKLRIDFKNIPNDNWDTALERCLKVIREKPE